ncbi:hypothetical protein AV654_23865 [Paenibacillus elgii]|uniref:Uncharacterized protein n=1 Tax=Paenibacillus elgii TaxID=189691 RepID=A0A163WDJ8_9BACL|nr:hypothetical protein [Paenibacillus elgii]KZE76198.1 hypothetical protein AV654_23865 [Paenibacillus elgii]
MKKKSIIILSVVAVLILCGSGVFFKLIDDVIERKWGGTISKAEYNEKYKVIEKEFPVNNTFFLNLQTKFLIELNSGGLAIEVWNPKEEKVFSDQVTSEHTYMNSFKTSPMKGVWKIKLITTPETEGKYQGIFQSDSASLFNWNNQELAGN